ncbi:MAG: glutamate racemase [Rhabdochlamydiaceae bacterium]|jgi:glutamate racemase
MDRLDPRFGSIGIFDSGFGGLTVMRAIREFMPFENIIYFGDTARLPYGSKSSETILRYSLENASFLMTQGIKVLVIACNTACSAALEQVRHSTDIPVIGITEQGIEEVSRHFNVGKIAILGTRATITSGVYQHQILLRCTALELYPISCPLLVPLVEEGYVEHPMSALIVQEYLRPLKNRGINGMLLGCTHYPLLQSTIQHELGPDVLLIDPSIACAEKTRAVLAEKNLLNPSTHLPHYQFFVSDAPEKFRLLGKTFLNYPIEHVQQKVH